MRRVATVAVAILLATTACGGSDDDAGGDGETDGPSATRAATTQPATPDETASPSTTGGGNDGEPSEGSGPSTATVTLGTETYNFSTEGAVVAQCLTDLFGIFSVQLPMIDDAGGTADGSVAIVGLPEGTDPDDVGQVNSIEVSVSGEDWIADEADMMFESSDLLEAGMSQVDTIEIDGRTVRGTATFFRQNSVFAGEVETLTGAFEATCGEERTS